jgi:phosphoribosylanthranilate isomerase
MKLKVCGMTETENILQVGQLLPDYMGFIFYDKSPRDASEVLKKETVLKLPSTVKKVGVFVNPSRLEVIQKISRYQLDLIQLHGEETPEFCEELKMYVPIIKAFGVDESFDFDQTREYDRVCEHYLFDTKSARRGGSGKRFDWKLLFNYSGKKSFFLSGGIGVQNAKSFPEMVRRFPLLQSIDVNSHFETEPGIKDVPKIKKLMQVLKQQQDELSGK